MGPQLACCRRRFAANGEIFGGVVCDRRETLQKNIAKLSEINAEREFSLVISCPPSLTESPTTSCQAVATAVVNKTRLLQASCVFSTRKSLRFLNNRLIENRQCLIAILLLVQRSLPESAITIRSFHTRDLPRVSLLEEEAFGSDAWPEELFRLYARQFPDLFLVAKVGSRIAGYCVGRLRTSTSAEIDSVAVVRKFQRRGVARVLVHELLRRFRRHGARVVGLMVRPDNAPALAFYDRLGFVHRRTIPDYYGDGSRAWRLIRSAEKPLR